MDCQKTCHISAKNELEIDDWQSKCRAMAQISSAGTYLGEITVLRQSNESP